MARKPPLIELKHPISRKLFAKIEAEVRKAGYSDAIARSETIGLPLNATAFAIEAIYVVCNSGMSNRAAVHVFTRCIHALQDGLSATSVFRHPGKAAAIDEIWRRRRRLFRELKRSTDLVAYCGTLPWVGPVTKFHLAKNLGADVAKPDVHLNRLADAETTTAQALCERLAKETGYKASTIDLILWRACADRIIDSKSTLSRQPVRRTLRP